jgi:hypothetical protein
MVLASASSGEDLRVDGIAVVTAQVRGRDHMAKQAAGE